MYYPLYYRAGTVWDGKGKEILSSVAEFFSKNCWNHLGSPAYNAADMRCRLFVGLDGTQNAGSDDR